MDPTLRTMQWKAVEEVFTDLHLPLGTPFPIAIMVQVRKEEAVPDVRTELGRAELEVVSVDKRGWPFGRRWEVAAKSRPQPIARAEVERWLDELETKLARHDATIATWGPLVPAA